MPLKNCFSNVTICLLCVLLLLNCGGRPPAANNAPPSNKLEARTTGTQGGTLTYRLTTAPKTFNYLLAEDEASIMAAFFPLTSRLIDFDHGTS